jgi:hypothetical protein
MNCRTIEVIYCEISKFKLFILYCQKNKQIKLDCKSGSYGTQRRNIVKLLIGKHFIKNKTWNSATKSSIALQHFLKKIVTLQAELKAGPEYIQCYCKKWVHNTMWLLACFTSAAYICDHYSLLFFLTRSIPLCMITISTKEQSSTTICI